MSLLPSEKWIPSKQTAGRVAWSLMTTLLLPMNVICGTFNNKSTLGRAEPRQEPHNPKSRSTKPLLQDPWFRGRAVSRGASPTQLRVGQSCCWISPFPGHHQPLFQPLDSPELLLPALSGPNQGSASWKSQTPQGKGKKNILKKRINHTLDTVITMRSWMSCFTSTLQIISQAGKWVCWVSASPGEWRVLVCWILAWHVQSHTECTLSVVVGVLNKIDGVGASWWILFDLEVLCWQAKGAQDQIAQILQFAQHFFL